MPHLDAVSGSAAFVSVGPVFHGRKYLICSLIVIVAAMLPFFMMFEGRKPKAREIMVISVLAAIGVAGRAAFFMVPVSTGGGYCDPYRCVFRRRGRFSCWLSNHDVIQHVYGTGPGRMADVLFWHHRVPGRNSLPERNLKSKEAGSLHLWIFKCGPDLRRDHEPGKHPDVLWVYHTGQPGCFLYFRNPGGPGACTVNCDLFMVFEQAAS